MTNINLTHTRRLTIALATAVIFISGMFAADVSAQSGRTFEIEVPFDFVIGSRTFPAARYRIGRLDAANPDTLAIRTSTHKLLLIVQTQRFVSGSQAEFSQLSFKRSGETNILNSIRASGQTYESRLPAAKNTKNRITDTQVAQTINITNK